MKYHFKIHKEGKGFWAECLEIPECVTQGDSKKELFENMKDAINTYLEEPEGSQFLSPLPRKFVKKSRSIVEISVEPSIALAFSIRKERIQKGFTQKEVAQKLGMKGLYSYQRLERKCNPTLEVLFKLVCIFPALSLDQILR